MAKTNNKTALITGGTSGIGYELAKLFAKDGYNLIIVARGEDGKLETVQQELEKEHGVMVMAIAKNLFGKEAATELYYQIKESGIEIDVLVNDAGQGCYGEFINNDLQKELNIIHLNIVTLVTLTKHFLKDFMARKSGKILNLSSMASKSPGPWQAVYHGTKAFVQSFTEAIRSENKETGIIITALLPGATDTDFFNKAEMLDSKIFHDKDSLADPADVAKDGYEALMTDKDMVVSGFKNKVAAIMSNVLADSTLAENTKKKQEPIGSE
jgi:short-subunit dehydrogenase